MYKVKKGGAFMELQFPDTICGILSRLVDQEVIIVLRSGEKERIKVLAVSGNVVVAKCGSIIKFINCDCICEIIVECADIIDRCFPFPPCR